MLVTDKGAAVVDGRRAQAFTLSVTSGKRTPDLLCVVSAPSCFKHLSDKPMDVVVVETSAGPLWIGAEYTPSAAQRCGPWRPS